MTGPLNLSAGFTTGLVVGAIVGFAWSQGTKSAMAKHTTTTVDGEAVTVRVNYRQAALDGLLTALRE